MSKHIFTLLFLLVYQSPMFAKSWEDIDTPVGQHSDSIGSYSNGCLSGGKALELTGPGYQVIRQQRKRYFGHETMIDYLTNLASRSEKLEIGQILVADIAMPRGGRFNSGHASHQTGLDADIWLRLPSKPLSKGELDSVSPYPVVDTETYQINDYWTEKHGLLLQTAASDDRVSRIFVHPVIKQKLCDSQWKERDWLQKIRPWWGHYYHFHVRLACPEGDSQCIAQAAPPAGEGCGAELASWKPELTKKQTKTVKTTPKKKRKPKIPPSRCIALLHE
jgi:penicillin-insensitive murein endopeptidase